MADTQVQPTTTNTPARAPGRSGTAWPAGERYLWEGSTLEALIASVAGEADREALLQDALQHARALAGPAPSELERSLAVTGAICWAAWHARANLEAAQDSDRSVSRVLLAERRIDHALKRYLAVLKTLAAVRRAVLPPVTLNLANTLTHVQAGG